MKKIFILILIALTNLAFAQQKLEFTLPSNPDVTVQYSGEVKNGKANGYGEAKTFFKDNPDGTYKGNWKDNDYHGQGVRTWLNGDVDDGGFLNGNFHGKGTLNFGIDSQWKGEKFVGDFINGQRTGKGTYTWANGDTYTGSWVNGFRSGYGKNTYTNGKIEEGQWENNVFKGGANTAVANNTTTGKKQSGDDAFASRDIWIKGRTDYEKGQYDLAIQEYNKAIQLYPTMNMYYIDRGRAYLRIAAQTQSEEKLTLSLNDFNKAIELKPQDALAYIERGKLYYVIQEYQKALNDLTKAIDLDKNTNKYIDAYYSRSMLYKDLNQPDKAEADMRKYKELGGK